MLLAQNMPKVFDIGANSIITWHLIIFPEVLQEFVRHYHPADRTRLEEMGREVLILKEMAELEQPPVGLQELV